MFLSVIKQMLICIQINEDILQLALKVYHADLRENEHSKFLRRSLGLDKHLKAISGFDAKDWDLVKHATAFKTMVDPDANLLPIVKTFKVNLTFFLQNFSMHMLESFHFG